MLNFNIWFYDHGFLAKESDLFLEVWSYLYLNSLDVSTTHIQSQFREV